jgi:DNA-binding CsgD family transcriptional regulator
MGMQGKRNELLSDLRKIGYLANLNDQELECLSLRINCRGTSEIAKTLNISNKTTYTYLHQLQIKLRYQKLSEVHDTLKELGVLNCLSDLSRLLTRREVKLALVET